MAEMGFCAITEGTGSWSWRAADARLTLQRVSNALSLAAIILLLAGC